MPFPLIQLGPDYPLTNAAFAKLAGVLNARRNTERDRAIYHGLCERIGELARFTGRVELITDPDLKRRALELLRDFNGHYSAQILAEIELAQLTHPQLATPNPQPVIEEIHHASN